MNWILDHLQILIGAAAAVAYWLNQRRGAKTESADEPPGEVLHEKAPEPDEPSVLIPHDIRRRILEQLGIPQPEIEPVVQSTPPPLPVVIPDPPRVPRAAVPLVKPVASSIVLRPTASSMSTRRNMLKRAVESPGKIREAILLREILGPPVGLNPADRSRAH